MSDDMRARRAQQSDEELLLAYFFEDLTPAGRAVVAEQVAARVGPVDAYLEPFARAQGEVLHRFVSTRVVVDGDDESLPLPPMRGLVMFTEHGVGVVPRGPYEERRVPNLGDGYRVPWGAAGGLAGLAIGQAVSDLAKNVARTGQRVPNLARPVLPVPLLAKLDRHAVWLSADLLGELRWSVGGGEVYWDDERVFECDFDFDTRAEVTAWATFVDWPIQTFVSR